MLCKITAEQEPSFTAKKILDALDNNENIIHIENGPTENIERFYNCVANTLGKQAPMEEDANGNKTGAMHTHIKHPWHEPSNSYSHSSTRQPFHTDGSYEAEAPQISYFFCKKQADYGGATIFIDGVKLETILKRFEPELLALIQKELVEFAKGKDSKIKPILDKEHKFNWNWHRCDHTLTVTKKFHDFLETKIFEGGLYESINLKEGDALFFMDQMVLHGRHSFIGSRWLIKGGVYYERQRNN